MKIIELPILYLSKEAEKLSDSGLETDELEESAIPTTFYVPNNTLIRINPRRNTKTTALLFNDDESNYVVNLEYENVRLVLNEASKK